jgi:hypothetical protein
MFDACLDGKSQHAVEIKQRIPSELGTSATAYMYIIGDRERACANGTCLDVPIKK